MKELNGVPHHRPAHHRPTDHRPPRERRNYIKLGEYEKNVFMKIFGDEETANAAMEWLYKAPAEQQNRAFQYLRMLDENYEIKDRMAEKKDTVDITDARWKNPFLVGAEDIYVEVYGERGKDIVNDLEHCPYENAVLSRLFTYVYIEKKGEY